MNPVKFTVLLFIGSSPASVAATPTSGTSQTLPSSIIGTSEV